MTLPHHERRLAAKGRGLALGEAALVALGQALQAEGYHFTTVSPATHARVRARDLDGWARSLRDVFGWSRRFHRELLSPRLFELMCTAGVVLPDAGGWRSSIRFASLPCAGGDLLCAHSAWPTESGDAVFFGPDTYRYCRALQQQLEQLKRPPARVIDIGTGSGAGALVVARQLPHARVFATDINIQALRLCRGNAALADVDNVHIGYSDLLHQMEGVFDLIIANPPYLLDPLHRLYRYGGGAHGEALSIAITRAALQRLAPGGTLLLYSGVAIVDGNDPLLEQVSELVDASGSDWEYQEIDPDVFGEELDGEAYADADRIAAVLLRVTRTAAASPV